MLVVGSEGGGRSHLLEPGQVVVHSSVLQEGPELGGDVEPDPSVVRHVPHERKRLIGLPC